MPHLGSPEFPLVHRQRRPPVPGVEEVWVAFASGIFVAAPQGPAGQPGAGPVVTGVVAAAALPRGAVGVRGEDPGEAEFEVGVHVGAQLALGGVSAREGVSA